MQTSKISESPAPTENEQLLTSPNLDAPNLPKNLVQHRKNRPITTSRTVAYVFDKNHKDVLRAIKNLGCSHDFWQRNFAPRNYVDSRGKTYPEYEISKNGFVILAMGYNGEKAMQFKEAYISRFDAIEAELQSRHEKAVLQAKDFVQLMDKNADFGAIMATVPTLTDAWGRTCYHYLLSLERLGFSTRSGQVWKRQRRNPNYFMRQDNADYVAHDFLYNMFIGRIKAHNDQVFRQPIQPQLPFEQKGGAQ